MKIGELAKRTGLAASAIRFYESKGLLKSVDRLSNGYREYPPEAATILGIIVTAQQTGFTLDEIKGVLPADPAGWRHDELMATLHRKLADIDAMQQRLATNKAHLLALIDLIESKPDGMACADNAARVMDCVGLPTDERAVEDR
jgi:DNA-binding transcriptional MerR regulator